MRMALNMRDTSLWNRDTLQQVCGQRPHQSSRSSVDAGQPAQSKPTTGASQLNDMWCNRQVPGETRQTPPQHKGHTMQRRGSRAHLILLTPSSQAACPHISSSSGMGQASPGAWAMTSMKA